MSQLDVLCKALNKKSGEEIVQTGVKEFHNTVIPLSSPIANYCLYGGIPMGRLIEFFGDEGSGKTTTSLDVCANAQKLFKAENPDNPRKVLFLDAENTYDPVWASKLGVDSNLILFIKPMAQTAEELFQFILDAIDTGEIGLVIIDSIGVLVSQQAYDKDMTERTYGGISVPLTNFSKKAEMLCHKHNCTIIGINQMRDNLNSPYGGATTTGGRAWKHNCFSGNTKFVTNSGLRRFRDCKDGEEVTVVDMNGDLRKATVHKYGEQQLQKVTLATPNMQHNVICTPDHRWVLSDGSVTENLKVGDKLYFREENINHTITTKRQAEMFCLGMAIGDGTDYKMKDSIGIRVVLCGDKSKYSSTFEVAGYRSSKQGKYIGYQKLGISKQEFLNGKCWKYLSPEDKRYIFMGYYSADGSNCDTTKSCVTTDIRVLEFIQDTCNMAGYFVTSMNERITKANSYKPNSPYWFVQFTTHTNKYNHWTVKEIKECGISGTYCVEEPVTHTFTLEKGVVTGNCSLRIQFRRGDFFDEKGTKVNSTFENPSGNLIQISVVKSKCFPNDHKTGFYSLHYYKGILVVEDTVDLAIKENIIQQAGAWFNLTDSSTGELIEKFQGKAKLVDYLKSNEDQLNRIKDEVAG